jgi:hypothetical protein
MITAILILCLVIIIRELSFMHERKRWELERKDLYSRIQAGSLQEYERVTKPSKPIIHKDRDQRVAEEAEKRGIPVSNLQYPSQWK